jgi:hypothetical protein
MLDAVCQQLRELLQLRCRRMNSLFLVSQQMNNKRRRCRYAPHSVHCPRFLRSRPRLHASQTATASQPAAMTSSSIVITLRHHRARHSTRFQIKSRPILRPFVALVSAPADTCLQRSIVSAHEEHMRHDLFSPLSVLRLILLAIVVEVSSCCASGYSRGKGL